MSFITPQHVTFVLSILTVVGDIFLIAYIAILILQRFFPSVRRWHYHRLRPIVSNNALLFGAIVAIIATLGSLYFSEIAQYTPCKLCWFQRIFMYPQVILLWFALWKNDAHIAIYSLLLSLIGTAIAGYHYLLQINAFNLQETAGTSCSVVGYSSSCADKFTLTFGYVTIPMMALTAFLLIIVCMTLLYRSNKA